MLTLDKVRSVYSGKAGMCCCGCAGEHRYPMAYAIEAEESRGYRISPEEIDDGRVKRIVNKLNKLIVAGVAEDEGDYVCATVGSRIYVAYLRSEKKAA
jgi:hypothetical protein